MAGGILIALMILSALILMFTNLSAYQNSQDDANKATQIAEFNNQFMPYDKSDLTLMELKTLYNKIESYNKKNENYNTGEKIENNIKEIYKFNNGLCNYTIDTNFSDVPESSKSKRKFKCKKIKYDSNGKINYMEFEETTPASVKATLS